MTWPPPSRCAVFTPPGGRAMWLAAALFLGLLRVPAATQAQEKTEAKAEAKTEAKTYVGSEVCQACHEEVFKNFQKNPHRSVETGSRAEWKGNACESCHGPGSKHAEAAEAAEIRNPAKLPAAQSEAVCLACHSNKPPRVQSSHAKNEVACVTCHTMHKSQEELVRRAPAAVNQQCAGCHTSVSAQFRKPYHHRLPENAMSCVDCHNPHGSFLATSQRTVFASEPACVQCHADKRGPFVFEHAPVRLEGCAGCHQPHGSSNPRMLARPQVRTLCLECHANIGVTTAQPTTTLGGIPPAFHDLRSPRYQNCTICHVKIHGSNVSRALLR